MVVGGLAIPAGGALAQDVATAVATKAALDYMDAVFSTSETVSKIKQRATFKKLAGKHTTLGYPEQLIRQTFAMSPLLKRMRETTLVRGIVYIAYVPPGKGKTNPAKPFSALALSVGQESHFAPVRALRHMPSQWQDS